MLAVGGGTQNAVWRQATSDIGGVDQIVCDKTVGASYGDAFMAALAVGNVEIGDIGGWNPVAEMIRAAPSAVHEARYGQFRRLYEQTKDIAAEL